ncbi:MAG: hypothetical protein HY911_04560 [Desulfobacterales bacterium]|nr:hypothetical protein [Desulfobacterales bacterium]
MIRVTNPPSNLFVDGNPALGTRGTRVLAAWLNHLQEELCAVIDSEGIVVDGSSFDMLLTAIAQKISGHAGLYNPHGASSAATPSRIMLRDSAGRSKVAAPAATDDVARLDTVQNAPFAVPSFVDSFSSLSFDASADGLASIAVGNVAVGDLVIVSGCIQALKGATAGQSEIMIHKAGTCVTESVGTGSTSTMPANSAYFPAALHYTMAICATFRVTEAGTLDFDLWATSDGSSSTQAQGKLVVEFIRKH